MGLFGIRLPGTSYGYVPPARATACGWECIQCSQSEQELVRRWPKACSQCGAPADPRFNYPWGHHAEGVKLQWLLRRDPEHMGGHSADRWQIWQFLDACLRGDSAGITRSRSGIRAYAAQRQRASPWWYPGHVFCEVVMLAIDVGDLDGAAEDLIDWIKTSSTGKIEAGNSSRANCHQVILAAGHFHEAPRSLGHPRAPQIRRGCLTIVEQVHAVVSPEYRALLARMTP